MGGGGLTCIPVGELLRQQPGVGDWNLSMGRRTSGRSVVWGSDGVGKPE